MLGSRSAVRRYLSVSYSPRISLHGEGWFRRTATHENLQLHIAALLQRVLTSLSPRHSHSENCVTASGKKALLIAMKRTHTVAFRDL